jgi:hypothetical protein
MFDTKIAVLLRDDLASWQALNVTAFLVSGLAARTPEIIGEDYEDGDGVKYLPMFGQPVLVFQGDADVIKKAHRRAGERGLRTAVFTEELFQTGNDTDNRAAVKGVPTEKLNLVGIALHGPRSAIDKIVKGAKLHP